MESARLDYEFGLANESVRESADGTLTISGIASNWAEDREGDVMDPRAFDKALRRYLTVNPILLYMHRLNFPMGQVTRAEVRPDGLFVEAQIPRPPRSTEAYRIYDLVKRGIVRAFSVGGKAKRVVVGGVKKITEWDLREVSICPLGVNATTTFSVQAGKCFGDDAPADPLADVNRRLEAVAIRDLEKRARLVELKLRHVDILRRHSAA